MKFIKAYKIKGVFMDSQLDNIEEYDNDSYFDEMTELVHPLLDDILSQALIHLKEEHNLSDNMVLKLKDSWVLREVQYNEHNIST